MQSAARAKVPAGRHVDLQMKDRRFEKESLTAVMRAFMLEHEIAPQALADRLRWQNLGVVEKILPPHRALHRHFSMEAVPTRPPLQNRFAASQTGQHLRTCKEIRRIIRARPITLEEKM